jgi:hypothetical protein
MLGIRDNVAYSVDDENHSAHRVFNRMCIQALSFNDYKNPRWRALYNICKDTVIKSPFNSNQIESGLNIKADDYLAVAFAKKFREDLPDYRSNHSKRICAFRDYNRRNLVVYLTMNFKSTEFMQNDYSENPYKELEKIAPDTSIPSVDPKMQSGIPLDSIQPNPAANGPSANGPVLAPGAQPNPNVPGSSNIVAVPEGLKRLLAPVSNEISTTGPAVGPTGYENSPLRFEGDF